MRKNKLTGVSQEKFVLVYETCNSAEEAASKLGMSAQNVKNRANYYRKQGVNLKEFAKKRKNRVDVSQLNAIIAELRQRKTVQAIAQDEKKDEATTERKPAFTTEPGPSQSPSPSPKSNKASPKTQRSSGFGIASNLVVENYRELLAGLEVFTLN